MDLVLASEDRRALGPTTLSHTAANRVRVTLLPAVAKADADTPRTGLVHGINAGPAGEERLVQAVDRVPALLTHWSSHRLLAHLPSDSAAPIAITSTATLTRMQPR